jgi:hypothetical protein
MAHYAFLDENNIVTLVIPGVDEWDTIEGKDPETWYGEFRGQTCKRTSYHTINGEHVAGGVPFRLNYAGIGFYYDEELDAFIPPSPYPSWTLIDGVWQPPIPMPDGDWMWDEDNQQWVEPDEAADV